MVTYLKCILLMLLPVWSMAQTTNVVRINSGGGAQNYSGQGWVQDQYFTGGTTYSTTSAIGNTVQDQIYQSERYGNFTYKIPAVSGKYKISLHFAEIYWTTTGARTFSISVENQFSQTNVDLFAAYGSNNAGVITADNIVVNDGFIDVTITTIKDNGKLSGIEVDKYDVIITPPDPPTDTTDCVICQTQVGPQGPAGKDGKDGLNGVCPNCPPSTGGALPKGYFDCVAQFGAKGDGVTDDSNALQACFDAASAVDGTVILPPSPTGKGYKITRTLDFGVVPGDQQTFMSFEGGGHHGWQILYYGPSGQPAIRIIGLKGGIISGMKVRIMGGISNSAAYEIGTSVPAESTSCFSFINCDAELGNGQNNIGWRLGLLDGMTGSDISQILWSNCSAWGGSQPGQIGWDNVGHNTLQLTWNGGGGAFLDKLVRCNAGGSMYFFGLGASHNNIDFELNSSNSFSITGGRFEVGKTFLKSTGNITLSITNIEIGDYNPPNGRVFELLRAGSLIIDGLRMESGSFKGAQTFYLGGNNPEKGSLFVKGGSLHNVSDPFYTEQVPGMYRINIDDVGRRGSTIHYNDSFFTNKP